MPEEWRPVVGYEGFYEVSNLGRVRSLERTVPLVRMGKPGSQRRCSKVLRLRAQHQGYVMVALYRDRQRADRFVHALVAEAWHGPRPEGLEVCHANDVKTDNRPENLRYGSRSENLVDAVRNGINPLSNRTHCINGHEFTAENTARIVSSGRRPYRRCRTCARLRRRASKAA